MKSVSASVFHRLLQVFFGLAIALAFDTGRAYSAGADDPLAFKGAQIGMSLREWQAVPIPPGDGNAPERRCSNEHQLAKIPGVALGAEEIKRGLVACTYVQRFGHDILPESIVLDPGFEAQNLTYLFAHGALVEIRFKASVDAYPHLRAALTQHFGKPVQTVVSAASTGGQRRRQTWRAPTGSVTLEDPSPDMPTLLSVRYAAAAHRPRYGPILTPGTRHPPHT
jgi:hypothetical protein